MQDTRRQLLLATLAGFVWPAGAEPEADAQRALRAGGAVAIFRHAMAPGVYDPPGMNLADCSTQRNLDEQGREQARRLGAGFAASGLRPARVLSSPWCRCVDTARLAFGSAIPWDALSSPSGSPEADKAARLQALRAALAAVPAGGFEVWVTHNFVIADLVGVSTASAEGLVLRADGARPRVLARLAPPA